jgi:amino acid transporter
MTVSTFGFMTATMLSTPRTLFALATDGFLPRPLGMVHAAYRTPHVAIVVQAALVCAIALTGTYVRLALVSDVAILLVYLACCVSAVRLRRIDAGADAGPFRMPAGAVVPWLAAALIVGLLVRATGEAWLLTGAVAAVAAVAYLARARRVTR